MTDIDEGMEKFSDALKLAKRSEQAEKSLRDLYGNALIRIAELEAQVARLTAILAGQNLKVTEFYVDEAGEWHRVGGDT